MRALTRTSRLILTVLAKGPSHGYGVIQWVKEVTGGTETLAVGSVYGTLDKLETQGLVEPDRDEIENGRTRRYYRITERGTERLTADIARLATEVSAAQQALKITTAMVAPS